ncbi:YkvA family protein [Sporosarcina limicola]|uniref:Uncharacterized membrane protein YkvA (DUF1232 family) n=1 Tax=Sporosarcina limicola TaxID=34101 RepID=A0A927MGR1_9BACL|nr:YkvA family protein [Sporosarcina limicola]MBE1554318.1 uncharacterized membrane protein YkvA (DUF1232 family) [Sporosarcina limicola]
MGRQRKGFEDEFNDIDLESGIQNVEKRYSDKRFWSKVKRYGKRAGKKTVYYSLLLFYAAKSPAVPKSSKMIIVGALSYLIFPVDLIPDFIPIVGLADDSAVIATAVYKVISHIDDDVKYNAKKRLGKFFGDRDIDEKMLK